MTKKLFSIFVTSFFLISGVIMMPGGLEALTMITRGPCQVGGIIQKTFLYENMTLDGLPSGYYLDIYILESSPLSELEWQNNCPHAGSWQQYFFPLSILPAGITSSSLENRFIDFVIDDNGDATDPVISEKNIHGSCIIEGEMRNNFLPVISNPVMCGEGYNIPCHREGPRISLNITAITSEPALMGGQCNSIFTIGQRIVFPIFHSHIQGYTTDPVIGKKVTVVGELTEKGFYPVTASIEPEKLDPKPKPDPKPEEPKDKEITKDTNDEQQDESDLIPLQPIEPNDQQGVPFWFGVIIMGLVSVIIIMWMYIRMRLQDK